MVHTARNTDLRKLNSILKEQSHHMHDMVVPAQRIEMTGDGFFNVHEAPIPDSLADSIDADADGTATLPYKAMDQFHSHLAQKLPIPAFKRAYDYMRQDETGLASDVVNTYLQKDDRRFLVRTFRPEDEDGGRGLMRALLSDRYRVIQNRDVMLSAAKAVKDAGLSPDVRANLTPGNMWCEFTLTDHPVDVSDMFSGDYDPTGGQGISPGFLVRNSETGNGALEVRPRCEVLVCSNGMTRQEDALRKIHLRDQMPEGSFEFSREVQEQSIKLAQSKIKEAVGYFASEDYVRDLVEDKWGEHVEREVQNPVEVMRNTADVLGINDEHEDELLDHFYETEKREVDVPQAVTEWAQTHDDPQVQYEMESQAWDVLDQIDELDVNEN
jgi:hypothetical protein